MSDLVRVRLDNGVEKNVGRPYAVKHGLTVLDEPTHRGDGKPRRETRNGGRPMKTKTSVAKKAAEKQNQHEVAESSAPETEAEEAI